VEESKATTPGFALSPSRFLPRRYKPRNVGSWTGHLAFANDLITAIRPRLIVELGTHWGESYFTFCQTVEEQHLSSLCYAVDHWEGDEHAGKYGEEVFDEVTTYNNRYYRQFSYLLRRSFDDALSQFEDESIGLLHIDGLHTYEAVAHDFRSWLPKVSKGGIILLHDICPRHEDFGVWRLWNDIQAEFPDTFEFHHSWGLGVVAKDRIERSSPLIELLFDSSSSVREDLRRYYVIYASHLENILGSFPLAAGRPTPPPLAPEVRVQIFPWGESGYLEETCQVRRTKANTWETVDFDLRTPGALSPIRIDPAGEPCFVEIGDIEIHAGTSGELLWKLDGATASSNLAAAGTATQPFRDAASFFVSEGDDPQVIVTVPSDIRCPAKVRVSLRITPASRLAIELFHVLASRLNQRDAQLNERDAQLRAALSERDSVATQLAEAAAQAQQAAARSEETLQKTRELLAAAEDNLYRMHHSLSWKVTAPIRKLMALLRSGPREVR